MTSFLNKEKICQAVKGSTSMQSTVITKQQTGTIHNMEKLLYIWMEDQIKNWTPLNFFYCADGG